MDIENEDDDVDEDEDEEEEEEEDEEEGPQASTSQGSSRQAPGVSLLWFLRFLCMKLF